MKRLINYFIPVLAMLVLVTGCDKVDNLPFYGGSKASVLTASATTIAPVAADSNKVALTLTWTFPDYATDSANVKYVIEMDASSNNFGKAVSKTVTGSMTTTYLAKELNTMLLNMGYPFNVPVDVDVRLTSSYKNNNERIASNTVKLKVTPYKIPPKVELPASGKLFIVGGATAGGWTNPVPTPTQELTRIDETTFGGIFELTANESYLILPINGNWDAKFGYVGANNGNNPAGDDFKAGGGDLKAPATTGWYKIILDFQSGKFTVTEFTQQHGLPAELFIVGGATPGGWTNPVPVPAQQFTRLNSVEFQLASLALTSGEKYLFLPENGNWGKKFGATDGGAAGIELGGPMKPEGADMPAPASGNYKITVNFLTNTYKLVKL